MNKQTKIILILFTTICFSLIVSINLALAGIGANLGSSTVTDTLSVENGGVVGEARSTGPCPFAANFCETVTYYDACEMPSPETVYWEILGTAKNGSTGLNIIDRPCKISCPGETYDPCCFQEGYCSGCNGSPWTGNFNFSVDVSDLDPGPYTIRLRATNCGAVCVDCDTDLQFTKSATYRQENCCDNSGWNNFKRCGGCCGAAANCVGYDASAHYYWHKSNEVWQCSWADQVDSWYNFVQDCDLSDGCVSTTYRDWYCSGGACTYTDTINDPRCAAPNNPPGYPTIAAPPQVWINYSPTFQVKVSDPDGDNVAAYFWLYDYVYNWGTWAVNGGISSWPTDLGTCAAYWWTAIGYDEHGAWGDWSANNVGWWWVGVDKVGPTANISYTAGTQTSTTIPIALSDADTCSGVIEGDVDVNINGTGWVDAANTRTSFNYTGVAGSTYQFRYRARDNANNWSGYSTGGIVTINRLPVGWHDGASSSQPQATCRAWGWSADPDNRDIDLNVRIFSDGVQIAAPTANAPRGDLTGVCPGGTCSFDVNIYSLITKDVAHSILVQSQDAQTGEWINLVDTPKTLTCTSPLPTVDIKARQTGSGKPFSDGPISIPYNLAADLQWTSTDATSCTATGAWSGAKAVSGNETTGVHTNLTYTYTITCIGPGGTSLPNSVIINVPPPPTNPVASCPLPGTSALISWTPAPGYTHHFLRVYNLDSSTYVAYNDDYVGSSYAFASTPGTNYSWWVHTRDAEGSWSNSVGTNFTCAFPLPTVDIKARPAGSGSYSDGPISVSYNTAADLQWTSTNATSCEASGAWSGVKAVSGTETTGNHINLTYTYTIKCTGPGGTSLPDSVIVNVPPPPTNPVASCPLPGTSALISWTPAPGYTHHFVRVYDTAVAWPPVVYNDDYVGSSYAFASTPGATYAWWVHTRDAYGNNSSATIGTNFTCAVPVPVVDIKARPAGSGSYSDGPITIDYNTGVDLQWTSTNATSCTATGAWSGGKSTSGNTETINNLLATATFIITCSGPGGTSLPDSVIVNVGSATLTVDLTANKTIGPAPLTGVSLTATVTGSAFGNINYTFYCNRADTGTNITLPYNDKSDNNPASSYLTPTTVCDAVYTAPGTYTAKVIVERGTGAAEDRKTITATNTAPYADTFNVIPSDFCAPNVNYSFSWIYRDDNNDPELRYDFQIATDTSFNNIVVDKSFPGLNNPVGTTNTYPVLVVPQNPPPAGYLTYNTQYYWHVRVWDDKGADSGWLPFQSIPFNPSHRYPVCNFTHTPQYPNVDEEVDFTDSSTCYDDVSTGTDCSAPGDTFTWTFPDGTPADSSDEIVQDVIFSSYGNKNVTLTVSDGTFSCPITLPVNVRFPLPTWKEIKPQ